MTFRELLKVCEVSPEGVLDQDLDSTVDGIALSPAMIQPGSATIEVVVPTRPEDFAERLREAVS